MRATSWVAVAMGLGAAGLVTAGCAPSPHGLSWSISFETDALRTRASVVEATIHQGSCTGPVVYRAEITSGSTMTMRPPELGPGMFGFAAAALDATCTRFADDCQLVTLPGPATVADVLHASTPEMAACAPMQCRTGHCEVDAGMLDMGTPDGGPVDAGDVDGGADVGTDAGCPGTTESSCTDGVDNDCNGRTDCNDTACAMNTACASCSGVTCSPCQTCTAASAPGCVQAPDGEACTSGFCYGGGCCLGCHDASNTCRQGNTQALCGTGGQLCQACGECQTCGPAGCMPAADGTSCSGGACLDGVCCRGCVSGRACLPGNAQGACGSGGGACATCGECQSCNGSSCTTAPEGSLCSGGVGRCWSGIGCCTGCLIVGTCQPGTDPGACGSGGNSCNFCGECQGCTAGSCGGTAPDGTSCMGGGGSCVGGSCCTGCMQGGTCQPGTIDGSCGYGGHACSPCGGCSGGVCSGGTGCGSYVDVAPFLGTYTYAFDTCTHGDAFASQSCSPGPTPPVGTADAVISASGSGTFHLSVDPGWTITSLDDFGSCSAGVSQCGSAGSWNTSGSSASGRFYWGIERTAGGCGRVTVTITRS